MRLWKYIFTFLLLILSVLVIAILQLPDGNLHIIACDVGQGDAILVTYKNIEILTDGGPGNGVLDCLSKHIPFWDRELELVILTHPQKDHYFGLIEVFKRYKVDNFLFNPIESSSQEYGLLKSAVGGGGVTLLNPHQGMKMGLGLIYLDILSPNQELLNGMEEKNGGDAIEKYTTKRDLNDFSVVYKLRLNKFNGLFTGDMSLEGSDTLALNSTAGTVNYIKIPHHGSKNGLTENLLKTLVPKIAVISVGRNNTYGHPNKEILEMLEKYGVKIYRTDEVGDVEFVTDGEKFWMKN